MIVGVKDGDLVRLLEHLHSIIDENEGHLLGPTLVARGRIALAGQRNLAELLHHFRRLGLARSDWCNRRPVGCHCPRRLAVLCAGATCSSPGRDPTAAARSRSGMRGSRCRRNPGWARRRAPRHAPHPAQTQGMQPLPPTSQAKGNSAERSCRPPMHICALKWPQRLCIEYAKSGTAPASCVVAVQRAAPLVNRAAPLVK